MSLAKTLNATHTAYEKRIPSDRLSIVSACAWHGIIALGVLCLLGLQANTQAAGQSGTGPIRMESVTVNEKSTEIIIKFDRPISHERSSLVLVLKGKIVDTLHPRLQAEPNVLFARIVTPRSGDYLVRWIVCPQGSNDRYDGEFTFTIPRF